LKSVGTATHWRIRDKRYGDITKKSHPALKPFPAITMFRLGVRTFATTARRAAETAAQMEALNQYGIGVSKAQGIVKGMTGGT
jgi:hypothetical protein